MVRLARVRLSSALFRRKSRKTDDFTAFLQLFEKLKGLRTSYFHTALQNDPRTVRIPIPKAQVCCTSKLHAQYGVAAFEIAQISVV